MRRFPDSGKPAARAGSSQRDKSGGGGRERRTEPLTGPLTEHARQSGPVKWRRGNGAGFNTSRLHVRSRQRGPRFVVWNVSPSTDASELNVSAAGKYIGADLELPDAVPREPEELLLTRLWHAVTTRNSGGGGSNLTEP